MTVASSLPLNNKSLFGDRLTVRTAAVWPISVLRHDVLFVITPKRAAVVSVAVSQAVADDSLTPAAFPTAAVGLSSGLFVTGFFVVAAFNFVLVRRTASRFQIFMVRSSPLETASSPSVERHTARTAAVWPAIIHER